jgi:hypothetical protein
VVFVGKAQRETAQDRGIWTRWSAQPDGDENVIGKRFRHAPRAIRRF